jgi:hypothetical protein
LQTGSLFSVNYLLYLALLLAKYTNIVRDTKNVAIYTALNEIRSDIPQNSRYRYDPENASAGSIAKLFSMSTRGIALTRTNKKRTIRSPVHTIIISKYPVNTIDASIRDMNIVK